MQDEEPVVNPAIVVKIAALVAAGSLLSAGAALAQTAAPAQAPASTQSSQASTGEPLKLQVPDPWAGGADSPGVYFGDHGDDKDGKDPNAAEVHGSVTTGIGYSKGYGTSTMSAVDLQISKPYGDGKTFDMQIHLEKTKGPGFSPYSYGYPYGGYYGPRYR